MLMEFMEISVSQGASQGRSFLARAFDLARPGVAPPLLATPMGGTATRAAPGLDSEQHAVVLIRIRRSSTSYDKPMIG